MRIHFQYIIETPELRNCLVYSLTTTADSLADSIFLYLDGACIPYSRERAVAQSRQSSQPPETRLAGVRGGGPIHLWKYLTRGEHVFLLKMARNIAPVSIIKDVAAREIPAVVPSILVTPTPVPVLRSQPPKNVDHESEPSAGHRPLQQLSLYYDPKPSPHVDDGRTGAPGGMRFQTPRSEIGPRPEATG